MQGNLSNSEFDPSNFEGLPACEPKTVRLSLPSAILLREFGTRHVAYYHPVLIRVILVLHGCQIPTLANFLRCLQMLLMPSLCVVRVRVLLVEYRERGHLAPAEPGDTRYLLAFPIYREVLIFMINFVDLGAALLPLEVA